jgi:uncharacterized protein YndB with AHSA1/START domain
MLDVVDVVSERTILAPVQRVAEFATDPSNVPEWYSKISSIEWLTPQPIQLGSKIAFVARFLGRTLRYTYQVVEFVPGQQLVMRTAEGPFPMETTYSWASVGDGVTHMTLRNRGEPTGFSKLVAPFMARAIRRANRNDLAKLAAVMERN